MAVNTLSYSELRAVSAILAELDGNEGQLTASVIADRIAMVTAVRRRIFFSSSSR